MVPSSKKKSPLLLLIRTPEATTQRLRALSAAVPSAKAELPERHPAGPRLALVTAPGCTRSQVAEPQRGRSSAGPLSSPLDRLTLYRAYLHHAMPFPPPRRPELAGYHSTLAGRPWWLATSCFKCFRHFKLMFQVFYMDVLKLDPGCYVC
jgi:hypothetical protein